MEAYSNQTNLAKNILKRLSDENYKGLDTSTINFAPRVIRLRKMINQMPMQYYFNAILSKILFYGGHRLHIFTNPEQVVLPKCLALAAVAHINCFRSSSDKHHLYSAKMLLQKLSSINLPGKMVWSHGYPYKLKDTEILRSTPNLVTTYFISEAFWYYSNFICDQEFQQYSKIANDSFLTFPFKDYCDSGCFMYTPVSNYYVHNANLMMVEMLAKSAASQNISPPSVTEKALLFSLSHFEKTGAFPYAGGAEPNLSEDNYHTGYVLRSLLEIEKSGRFPNLKDRIENCLAFGVDRYLQVFVGNRFVLRDKKGNINTHSLAESILFKIYLNTYLNSKQISMVNLSIKNTIDFLWDKNRGYFINLVSPISFLGCLGYIKDRTYLPRWSQAWMARALSEHARSLNLDFPLSRAKDQYPGKGTGYPAPSPQIRT